MGIKSVAISSADRASWLSEEPFVYCRILSCVLYIPLLFYCEFVTIESSNLHMQNYSLSSVSYANRLGIPKSSPNPPVPGTGEGNAASISIP
jgi:hypothetical protein